MVLVKRSTKDNQAKPKIILKPQGGKKAKMMLKASLPKRFQARMNEKTPVMGITGPVIQRMGRKAGVKRCSRKVHLVVRDSIEGFLRPAIRDGMIYASHCKRKTLTKDDMGWAFRRMGRALY